MALNVAKCTIIFGQNQVGWTESYYLANPSTNLDAEYAKLLALATKRILCSGAQTYVNGLKVSNELIKRDVSAVYFGPPPGYSFGGQTGKDSDFQDTAVIIRRFNADRTSNAPIYMRGIWDEVITTGGTFIPTTAWTTKYNAYKAQLLSTSEGWGFLGKDFANSKSAFVATVVSAVSGQLSVTTVTPVFNAPQIGTKVKVFISGLDGAKTLNGTHVVIPTADNAFLTVKRLPIFPYLGGGQVTNTVPMFYLNSFLGLGRAVERKAGRPLFLSVGRRRARVLA